MDSTAAENSAEELVVQDLLIKLSNAKPLAIVRHGTISARDTRNKTTWAVGNTHGRRRPHSCLIETGVGHHRHGVVTRGRIQTGVNAPLSHLLNRPRPPNLHRATNTAVRGEPKHTPNCTRLAAGFFGSTCAVCHLLQYLPSSDSKNSRTLSRYPLSTLSGNLGTSIPSMGSGLWRSTINFATNSAPSLRETTRSGT